MDPEDEDYRGILGAEEDDYERMSGGGGSDSGRYRGPADPDDLGDGESDMRYRDEVRRGGLNSFDENIAGSFVGGILGADARVAAARDRAEAETNRNYWERLNEVAPTEDELSVEYGLEDYVGGPGSVWARDTDEAARGRGAMEGSLSQLESWARGGLTDTDRAMMDETARREGMNARGDREAALSALEARGAGSSGASLAADLAAGEGAASRASSANTSLMGAAQSRAYSAARDAAALGGSMRDADARERSGLEAYGMWNTDYERGREGRNTGLENRTRESAAEAAQTRYENRERATAGVTNQYSTDVNSRARNGERQDENNRNIISGLAELIS